MGVINMKREGDDRFNYSTEPIPNEKPAYKAELGLSPTVTNFIPSAVTWAALAVGLATGLILGFYIARK